MALGSSTSVDRHDWLTLVYDEVWLVADRAVFQLIATLYLPERAFAGRASVDGQGLSRLSVPDLAQRFGAGTNLGATCGGVDDRSRFEQLSLSDDHPLPASSIG